MRLRAVLTLAGIAIVATATTACSSGALPGGATTPNSAQSSTGSGGSSSGGSSAEINACALLTAAHATALVGRSYSYSSSTAATIASGQDQCTYHATNNEADLVVIIYQPNSGVSFDTLKAVQTQVGTVTSVSGVGDKAIVGSIELDAQVGNRLLAVEGAGGLLTNDTAHPVAVAKAIIAALH